MSTAVTGTSNTTSGGTGTCLGIWGNGRRLRASAFPFAVDVLKTRLYSYDLKIKAHLVMQAED